MHRHDGQAIRAFLRAVDAHLDVPVSIEIVGGAVISVVHHVPYATADIDLLAVGEARFWDAYEAASRSSPRPIPINLATVVDLPEGYENRRERLDLCLGKLDVFVPEVHDLVISKSLRADERDLAGIEAIHKSTPLEPDLLVERFVQTGHAIGDPTRLRLNFTAVLARLWGEARARELVRGLPPPIWPGD